MVDPTKGYFIITGIMGRSYPHIVTFIITESGQPKSAKGKRGKAYRVVPLEKGYTTVFEEYEIKGWIAAKQLIPIKNEDLEFLRLLYG